MAVADGYDPVAGSYLVEWVRRQSSVSPIRLRAALQVCFFLLSNLIRLFAFSLFEIDAVHYINRGFLQLNGNILAKQKVMQLERKGFTTPTSLPPFLIRIKKGLFPTIIIGVQQLERRVHGCRAKPNL